MAQSSTKESFQIPLEVAEVYEERFVPALFAAWAPVLVDFAGIEPGMDACDVACGTGIVTRTIADRLAGVGNVIGIDLNEAMLTVARRVRPDIAYRQGDVAALPFEDGAFDAVTCQMALMFFPDRPAAIAEMARVTKSGGTVAVLVPSSLESQPVWKPFVDIATAHAGPEAASLLGTYWSCGDLDELTSHFSRAGLRIVDTVTRFGTATFPSVDALVAAEVESTPLVDRISPAVYEAILDETRPKLDPFTTPDGTLEAPIECHLIAGRR